jgi:F0F1-type ATP synthase gamma subunit
MPKSFQKSCSNVSASLDGNESKYAEQREVKNVLIGGHREQPRLAGAFNTQVFRQVVKAQREAAADGKRCTCFPSAKRPSTLPPFPLARMPGFPDTWPSLFDGLSFDK